MRRLCDEDRAETLDVVWIKAGKVLELVHSYRIEDQARLPPLPWISTLLCLLRAFARCAQLLRAGSAYYLIHGIIVKVLVTDNMTGMVEIEAPGLVPTIWI